jgi:hypothetical protein
MLNAPVMPTFREGGALSSESCGPAMLTPASRKLNGAPDSDPPVCEFHPNVLLRRRDGDTV